MLDPPAIGDASRKGQEQDIPARHEGARELILQHFDFDVAGEGCFADFPQNPKIDRVIISKARGPRSKSLNNSFSNPLPAFELDSVALPIVEADRFHAIKPVERPSQTGGEILPTREKYQSSAPIKVHIYPLLPSY